MSRAPNVRAQYAEEHSTEAVYHLHLRQQVKVFWSDDMQAEDIKKYCLSKYKAYETYPFGEVPICYKVNNKIFAQPYWNTIHLEDFPEEELYNMIDHAYETVWNSFSKKVQQQLLLCQRSERESDRDGGL